MAEGNNYEASQAELGAEGLIDQFCNKCGFADTLTPQCRNVPSRETLSGTQDQRAISVPRGSPRR